MICGTGFVLLQLDRRRRRRRKPPSPLKGSVGAPEPPKGERRE